MRFFLFRTAAPTQMNSDPLQGVLEAADVLRGNVLLHGWLIASDNFYLSDVPFFTLTRLLFGGGLLAIYLEPP